MSHNEELRDGINSAIQRRIDEGTFVFLKDLIKERPQLANHKLCFSPINFSIKTSSERNKIRPVVNASFKPGNVSSSYNDCQFKGSSLNRNLQVILIWTSQYSLMTVSDINDFYQSLSLSDQDICLNAMKYRRGGFCSENDMETLVSTKLNYGLRMAQYLSNKAKFLTSERFTEPESKQAHHQLFYSITDDIFLGENQESKLKQMRSATESGMARGGFKLKPWRTSYDDIDPLIVGTKETDWGGILGLMWSPRNDSFKIPVNLNICEKVRGARNISGQINTEADIKRLITPDILTKTVLARIVCTLFDPLLYFVQVRCILNLVYRKALRMSGKIGWNQLVNPAILPDVHTAVKMLLQIRDIEIQRYRAHGIKGDEAHLCISTDGGIEASCCRLFLRYPSEKGIECKYLIGG